MEALRRWANAIRINGIDSEVMTPSEIGKLVPLLISTRAFRCMVDSFSAGAAFPVTMPLPGAMPARRTRSA